jgi:hypothetical protein
MLNEAGVAAIPVVTSGTPPPPPSPTSELTVEQQYRPVEVASLMKRDVKTIRMWLRDPKHPLTGTQVGGQWYISKSHLAKFLNGEFG